MGDSRVLSMHYTFNRWAEPVSDNGTGFDPTKLGFPAGFASQLVKPSFPEIRGIAGTSGNDGSTNSNFGTGSAGSNRFDTNHTWAATLTQVYKTHTFRFGAEFWILQQAWRTSAIRAGSISPASGRARTRFTFRRHGKWKHLCILPAGLPSGGQVPTNATAFYSQHYWAGFVQDDWRLTPKLTLNLGLRWDLEQPVTERFNRLTDRFDPTAVNPITNSAQAAYAHILATSPTNSGVQQLDAASAGVSLQGDGRAALRRRGGTPRGDTNADYNEWQPRAGLHISWRRTP